ncbi:hypothetical protein [Paenalcaligenes suwonensis]|nr:hypothetical protein [Paenalcaligenes suwonensis]NHC61674.1 hypothetical protein [Paenalcaligenes suwonensis]
MTDLNKKPAQTPEKKPEPQTPPSSPFVKKTEAFNVQRKEGNSNQGKTNK